MTLAAACERLTGALGRVASDWLDFATAPVYTHCVGRPRSDVHERIVSAAHTLLLQRGVRSVVQVRVAKHAGVPQGHLTYYFPKKSDLLVAVARRFREDTVREIGALFQSVSDGADREERLLAAVKLMSEDRTRTRALLGLAIEADAHPDLRAELQQGASANRRFLAAVLGKPEPDADVDVVLALFWGLGVQYLVLGDAQSEAARAEARECAGRVLREHFSQKNR